MSSENDKLAGDLEAAEQKLAGAQAKVTALEAEVLSIQTKLEAYSSSDDGSVNIDKYIKQIRRLRTETGASKDKIRDLENKMENLEKKARMEECRAEGLQGELE